MTLFVLDQLGMPKPPAVLCGFVVAHAPGCVTIQESSWKPRGPQQLNSDALSFCAQFIPESARFNVSTGKTQAALATLQRIAKMNRSVMPEGKLVEPILVSSRRGGLLPAPEIPAVLEG